MKVDKFKYQDEWKNWVGLDVIKHSKKPFKSGKLIERVFEYTTNPHSGKAGFKFADESIVDCHQVKLVNGDDNPVLNILLKYNEYLTTFIDTDNIGIGMSYDDVVNWFEKQDINKTKVLTIPDIRNKLTPITNMIALMENSIFMDRLEINEYIRKEMEQSKKSVKYLSGKS